MVALKPKPHAAIERMLASPIATFPLSELPKFWRTTRITFVYRRPPDIDDGMRLPAAIRGALGEPLKQVSRERYGENSPQGTPFHAFYADHCMFEERWHVPKPFAIWCTSGAGRLCVEISLFGECGRWRDDVAEAMLRIMLPKERGGEGGISIGPTTRARRIWELEDVYWRERGHYPVPSLKRVFIISPVTPIVPGSQKTLKGDTGRMLFSIFARLAGLARWHRIATAEDLSFREIRNACRRTRAEVLFEPRVHLDERRSRTFAHAPKQETAFYLSLKISDYPEHLWPGFVLGTLCHAGYDTVQGYGRYSICEP